MAVAYKDAVCLPGIDVPVPQTNPLTLALDGGDPTPHRDRVSPGRLVSYGFGSLIAIAATVWLFAELSTPNGSWITADLGGLGRTVGLLAAAAVGVPAAVLAYHRQRALDTANRTAAGQHEHKVQADYREHRTGVERHLRERYTICGEQLGHDSSAIRLAGVYALASLADDWHDFGRKSERQVCIDLLCAYLRTRSRHPVGAPVEPEDPDTWHTGEEAQVRSAIIGHIRSRNQRADGEWLGCHFELSAADLITANLSDADLTDARLIRANLTRARLTDANLTGANLVGANLTGADLTGADLIGADLTDANLTDANLTGDVNFTDANLTDADLTRARLSGVNLFGVNLTGANLISARLTEADLIEADLTSADLTGANLTGANLTGGADLFGANLTGANLAYADLTGADLTGAILTGAILTSAILTGTNLTHADLTGADLTYADLTDAHLSDAHLADATLKACRYSDTTFWPSGFTPPQPQMVPKLHGGE
ncbi:pentapeptide repeat-containing protein [Rhodococcus sp. PAM 2766]|uniref:Pentapeptide repeat-containing protein n=1 Tax=Rhodococcus parequi TaxID=3137122 RepID=A0ABW9FBI1_9NOCA